MRPEFECRKPGFTEGCKVRMADGQEWTFPKPYLALVPHRTAEGVLALRASPPFGSEFQDGLQRYIDLQTSESSEDDILQRLTLRLVLAVELLQRNYDLTDEQVQELFVIEMNSDAATEMWSDINAVILGRNPKKA